MPTPAARPNVPARPVPRPGAPARPVQQAITLRRGGSNTAWAVTVAAFLGVGLATVVGAVLGRFVGMVALGALLVMVGMLLGILRLAIGTTTIDVTSAEVVVSRNRTVTRYARHEVAGLQVTYRDTKAMVIGGLLGGAVGAMLAQGTGPTSGQPLTLQVWTHGARKAKAVPIGMHKAADFAPWIARVQQAGIPVRHGG